MIPIRGTFLNEKLLIVTPFFFPLQIDKVVLILGQNGFFVTSSLLEEERKETNDFLGKKAASFKEKTHKRKSIRKQRNDG